MGETRGEYRVLVVKLERRRPLGKPRRRWEDNITMGLTEVEWGHELGISGSEQGQVAGCCEYGDELSGFTKCSEFLD